MVTQNSLRTSAREQVFIENLNFKCTTAIGLNKCLKQIKLPIPLYTCDISKVPSNISTMFPPLLKEI